VTTTHAPILPGQTIGILGGGQLGRMFAIAARRMGYRVHAFDPGVDCPTGQIADVEHTHAFDDVDAARDFARAVDVITFEFENVPTETLAAVAALKPVHPSPAVLDTCRHRSREKAFLTRIRVPCAPYRVVKSQADVDEGVKALGLPAILKTATFGYDGKGQEKLTSTAQAASAFERLRADEGVLEGFVDFRSELSVIVARDMHGRTLAFEPCENAHENHILDVTIAPARISKDVRSRAIALAERIAREIDLVGVLAVEMFLTKDDALLVNELAPRPHNSGHWTFDVAVTSQFEQQLRAVCGLPLGDPTLFRPVAMANLLGDLWQNGEPDWASALEGGFVKLHLYGKLKALPGRKMGHLVASADDVETARTRVLEARARLTRVT
jgi:5-(carboxyamino)imidazole ribonucleotide synthase